MPDSEYMEIMGPALVAGLMIAVIHAPLGIEVLRRGIVFIDLAIAQIAGLFIVLVNLWLHHPAWAVVQATAVCSAVCAALLFRWVEKAMPREQEAVIGSTFILAASAMLLLLADEPHGGEAVQHILVGQILFAAWPTVLSFAPVYVAGFLLWFLVPQVRHGLAFFLIFGVVVTASVQLVGVYVVFASLILPALAVNGMQPERPVFAIALGMAGIVLGLGLSLVTDLPTGPTLVFSLAVVALLTRIAHAWRCRKA
ncbi:MAG: metal ABC transporter permease [Alphaproteobacteria bacterium]|jgi:zinc/manganese transport system permease protein|nr:metal ABC transporter permease [Alphaproteobacteria bacterium]